MSIQNISANTQKGRLVILWELMRGDAFAISVQIARDVEFLDTARTFVVPPVKNIVLDTGKGDWYYRVGAWLGEENRGVIEWSGVYGPIRVDSAKGVVPSSPPNLNIQYVQPALDSLKFHTGIYEPYYAVVDYTDNALGLRASTAKSVYIRDSAKGVFDVLNLLPTSTYSLRVSTFIKNRSELPASSIKQLADGVVVRGKRPAATARPGTNTDKAVYAADKAILKEASDKQNIRFSSYAEYMQFLAAKARTTEARQPL